MFTGNLSLEPGNIIAAIGIGVTIIIASVSAVYTLVTNTKKYELTQSYRQEIMAWYHKVVSLMLRIIQFIKDKDFKNEHKANLLSDFSALIEVGRFYFPNSIDDSYGNQKPSAYQGHRDIGLSILVKFYEIAQEADDDNEAIDKLTILERHFTSYIFDVIKPRSRNMEIGKYLSISAPKSTTMEDYLSHNSECQNILDNE